MLEQSVGTSWQPMTSPQGRVVLIKLIYCAYAACRIVKCARFSYLSVALPANLV